MAIKEKSILDSVIYSHTTSGGQLEEENKILKETAHKLREELELFRKPPLMVCEINDIVNDTAIVKIPNGNQFLVNISKDCEILKPGDTVLAEQKNLTLIKRLDISK